MKAAISVSDAVYSDLLRRIKSCIDSAQPAAARAINRAQLALCLELGRLITERPPK